MRSKDKDVVRVVEEMKKAGVKELRGNEWKIEGDLVLKEGKVYVPKDEELSVKIVDDGLNFYFCFLFYFLFSFSFLLFFYF